MAILVYLKWPTAAILDFRKLKILPLDWLSATTAHITSLRTGVMPLWISGQDGGRPSSSIWSNRKWPHSILDFRILKVLPLDRPSPKTPWQTRHYISILYRTGVMPVWIFWQDDRRLPSWIFVNRKWRHSIRRPRLIGPPAMARWRS